MAKGKETHPKSPQGEKIAKAFKRDKKEDERPIRKASKGLDIKLNPDVKKHKTKKGL